MTDEPTTPAADECAYCATSRLDCAVADGCCEACESTGGCTHEPPPKPTTDLAKLTLRCGDLRAQRDEARATLADLQARVREAADWCAARATHNADDEGVQYAYEAAGDYVRWALDGTGRAETDPVSDSSASVDPSATPDELGPQIGAEGIE